MLITKFRNVSKGNLVGFANVDLPSGMFINDISIFCKNGFRWINFPSREFEVEGVKKYAPYCGLKEKEKKDAFQNAFLKALDEHIRLNPVVEVKAPTEEFGSSKGQGKTSYPQEDLPF